MEAEWNKAMNESLWRVPHRDHHELMRKQASEYLTVVSHDGMILCLNYPVYSNRSFIVTKEAGIKAQKYGSKDFFEDYSGRRH
jgi:hypothetical protein